MLGVEAGINSQPFAIFVTPKQRKMNIRKRFGTLRSRLGVEFQCPHCHSNNINNKHIGLIPNVSYGDFVLGSNINMYLGQEHTKKMYDEATFSNISYFFKREEINVWCCFIISLIFLIFSPCPKYTSLGVRLSNDLLNSKE